MIIRPVHSTSQITFHLPNTESTLKKGKIECFPPEVETTRSLIQILRRISEKKGQATMKTHECESCPAGRPECLLQSHETKYVDCRRRPCSFMLKMLLYLLLLSIFLTKNMFPLCAILGTILNTSKDRLALAARYKLFPLTIIVKCRS